jgi:hypothetical protein
MNFFFHVYMKKKASQIWYQNARHVRQTVTLFAMWAYAGVHQTDGNYNTAFCVISRLCEPVNNTQFTVYMNQFFSCSELSDHLWTANTKAVAIVILQCREIPEVLFSEKLKKVEKLMTQREQLAVGWCDVQDVYLLNTVHDYQMGEKPKLRGTHGKIKPNAVMNQFV